MDILIKYNIVLNGKQRFYTYPLPKKLFDLEYTSPFFLHIDEEYLKASSWMELVSKLSIYLLDSKEDYYEKIMSFSPVWTKQKIFVTEKRTNYTEIKPGLFVDTNHTALHSCWLVIDLLDFFGIDFSKCTLVIHRMPKAEPKEVRDYFRDEVKKELRKYLFEKKLLAEEKIEKIMKNLDYLNQNFARRKSGFDDLFLFDNAVLFANAKSKFIREFVSSRADKEKAEKLARYYLDYLTEFYGVNGYYLKK